MGHFPGTREQENRTSPAYPHRTSIHLAGKQICQSDRYFRLCKRARRFAPRAQTLSVRIAVFLLFFFTAHNVAWHSRFLIYPAAREFCLLSRQETVHCCSSKGEWGKIRRDNWRKITIHSRVRGAIEWRALVMYVQLFFFRLFRTFSKHWRLREAPTSTNEYNESKFHTDVPFHSHSFRKG